ncbi:hypothetical protein HYX14_00955 [Candidatus Woesearchaeota archaeon]|nr:hypothetical protein [Candidatus Woesearchaeota archaeon]
MVSPSEKLRCTQYICNRLEDSGLYIITGKDAEHVLVREKPEVREQLRTIDVVITNALPTADDFVLRRRSNQHQGIYTCPILYKDGKTAFVRMVERNPSWRTEKSLKKYSPQQINQMLHLRKIEKVTAEFLRGSRMRYYQPTTDLLPESIREFDLQDVKLDYSHIGPNHPSYDFVENSTSIDYKLPVELTTMTGAVQCGFAGDDPSLRAKLMPV